MQELNGTSDWSLLPAQKKALNIDDVQENSSDDEEIVGAGNVDVVSKSIEAILRTSRSPFTKSSTLPPKGLGNIRLKKKS